MAGPGASPSLHQPTPDTSASLADQLCHVSWAEGFASASQPLPALSCRRFIAHQAMGVRSESQFWESPSFGLLQQINQVLLILVLFACLGSFFLMNYYSGLSIIYTQVYQMVAALTTVAWWFGQFPYIVRRTPHPDRPANSGFATPLPHHADALHRLDFGARPYFFYYCAV